MATIFDVAKYFLEKLGPLSGRKLQKLCYYAQSWHLAWTGEPLFNENFEAWIYGPVCPELRAFHKEKDADIYEVPFEFFDEFNYEFTEDQLESLNIIIKDYGHMTPLELTDQTHIEFPWKNARGTLSHNEKGKTVITKESMKTFYKGLL